MTLKFPYTNAEYADFADTANKTGKMLVKKSNGDVDMVDAPPPPAPPQPSAEVLGMRDKYRQSTRSVCTLAGVEPVDKLTDVQYEVVVTQALQVDPVTASFLTQTISYCLFQLYRLDGNNAWDRI